MSLHVCKKQSCILKKNIIYNTVEQHTMTLLYIKKLRDFLLILSKNYWVNLFSLNICQDTKIHRFLEIGIRFVE